MIVTLRQYMKKLEIRSYGNMDEHLAFGMVLLYNQYKKLEFGE